MSKQDQPITAEIGRATITLDTPIARGEQTITAVSLRKPDSGELRGVKLVELLQMDVASLQLVLPRISQPTLTSADVARLDPVDLLQLGIEVSGFFTSKADRALSPSA